MVNCTSPLHSNLLFVYTVCCRRRGLCFSVLRTIHTDVVGDSSGRSYVTEQWHNVPLLRTRDLDILTFVLYFPVTAAVTIELIFFKCRMLNGNPIDIRPFKKFLFYCSENWQCICITGDTRFFSVWFLKHKLLYVDHEWAVNSSSSPVTLVNETRDLWELSYGETVYLLKAMIIHLLIIHCFISLQIFSRHKWLYYFSNCNL